MSYILTKRGLIVGRFQPPHRGHLSVIQQVLEEQDEIVIVIAAAQLSHTFKNPLTAGERMTLMRTMLENSGISPSKFWITPAEDIMDNSLWVHHIKRLIPAFDVFYGNNPFTKMLFEQSGFRVQTTGIVERSDLEGTSIRKKIYKSSDISQVVDPKVAKLLEKWNIKERLVASMDENPVADLV